MDITINTPALLFPAISLILLAYTNRFLALSALVRNLHERFHKDDSPDGALKGTTKLQLRHLRFRLRLVKNMQILGVLSFLSSILTMLFIYNSWMIWAHASFGIALLLFGGSLILSLIELLESTHSIEIELSDMSDTDPSVLDYFKRKLKGLD